jgi:ParB family chromosome partitioning protein
MSARHKGLGRGLDALLGGNTKSREREEDALGQLAIAVLRPGKYQPRTRMDEASLAELADSIRSRGVIQPIIVRPVSDTQYEILAGERRWRAARIAGLEKVPVVIREVPDEAALGIGLIENIQREDLNPIEEANGLARLIGEFKLTHEEVAKAIGRSRAGVTNLLRMLVLAPTVQEMVQDGRIDMGHARALLALASGQQTAAATRIVNESLSVREAERLVQTLLAATRPRADKPAPKPDADVARLEEELAERLGARVRIETRRKGGRVVIDYTDLEQLDGIVERLGVQSFT